MDNFSGTLYSPDGGVSLVKLGEPCPSDHLGYIANTFDPGPALMCVAGKDGKLTWQDAAGKNLKRGDRCLPAQQGDFTPDGLGVILICQMRTDGAMYWDVLKDWKPMAKKAEKDLDDVGAKLNKTISDMLSLQEKQLKWTQRLEVQVADLSYRLQGLEMRVEGIGRRIEDDAKKAAEKERQER